MSKEEESKTWDEAQEKHGLSESAVNYYQTVGWTPKDVDDIMKVLNRMCDD